MTLAKPCCLLLESRPPDSLAAALATVCPEQSIWTVDWVGKYSQASNSTLWCSFTLRLLGLQQPCFSLVSILKYKIKAANCLYFLSGKKAAYLSVSGWKSGSLCSYPSCTCWVNHQTLYLSFLTCENIVLTYFLRIAGWATSWFKTALKIQSFTEIVCQEFLLS